MIFSLRLSHLTNWAGEHCFKLASQHSLPGKPVEEFLILPTHLPKIRSLDHQTWTSWDPHPLKRSRCIPRFLKQIATHQQKGIFQFPVSQPSRWNKSPDEASLSSDRPCDRNKTPVPEETRRSGTCPPKQPCHQTIDFFLPAKGQQLAGVWTLPRGKRGGLHKVSCSFSTKNQTMSRTVAFHRPHQPRLAPIEHPLVDVDAIT